MNAVTTPATSSSPLAPFRLLLTGIGATNIVFSVGKLLWMSQFSSLTKVFAQDARLDAVGEIIVNAFIFDGAASILLGAFQLFASRQLKAQRRYVLCCVAFASLVLPYSMFHIVGGALGLIAIYKLTRPEVRSTFA